MASKNKRQAGLRPRAEGPPIPLRDLVDRLIAKERFKDAVKEAKICYKQESTPEHHKLLEQAYLLRAQQLQQGGMSIAAREVAEHLLDFGITDPALAEPSAALMLAVGMSDRALELQERIDSPEARERLTRQAADLAVLHPERGSPPLEIRDGASRVRSALEALTAGDEETASAELRDVARNSPFGDWKLFARGLAAFRRGETVDALANWNRLDPGRAAARIARALRSLDAPVASDSPVPAKFDDLERLAFGEPVLGALRELGRLVAEDRWTEALRAVGPLRLALQRIDQSLAERLTHVLYSPLFHAATCLDERQGENLVRQFVRVAEPLPIDPRWNRLWAMVWEEHPGNVEIAEGFWRKYLDDIKTSTAVRPEDRERAQALVLLHMGEEFVSQAKDLAPGGPGPRRVDPKVAEARRKAVECLEESLRLCPTHRPTYVALEDAHDDWNEPERAIDVSRRLLRVFPDDFETLVDLAGHEFRQDRPAEALEHIERARKLRPLDEKTAGIEWAVRVALARHLALEGRWDEGRAQFEAAGRLRTESDHSFHLAARRAVLELKAGQPDRAEELIAEAQSQLVDPTPLWLVLLIEARRYKLPKAERDRFEERWEKGLAKKGRGDTAGALAELIGSFLARDIAYPGRAEHVTQVKDYLRRASRVKYSREDLGRVCAFLGLPPVGKDLLEKMVNRGLKLFPDAPEFPMILGSIEARKGPSRAYLRLARENYQKALELALAHEKSDPVAARLLPQIKESLTALNTIAPGPLGGPPDSFFGMIEAMLDEQGIDPEEFLEELESLGEIDDEPVPRPRRKEGRTR